MKQRSKALARIREVAVFKLHQLPKISAYIDTGYSKQKTIDIIKKMYKNRYDVDVEKTPFAIILLEWEDIAADQEFNVTADLFNKDGNWDFEIKFSMNWNNKLNCHAFTTLRPYNKIKHEPGKLVRVYWPHEVTRMRKKIK